MQSNNPVATCSDIAKIVVTNTERSKIYHKLNVLTTETNLGKFDFTQGPAQCRLCNGAGRPISIVISSKIGNTV